MGIPYSREINAAFEQVTPLVAAGFKVLRTMKDISILLAVIQVLTVFFLFLILIALILLLYSVNPDLEHERLYFVTPFLRWMASISLWDVFRGFVSVVVGIGIVLATTWYFFFVEHKSWSTGVEKEADEDADKALEEIDGGKGKKKGKQKGKNDKADKEKEKEAEEKKGK